MGYGCGGFGGSLIFWIFLIFLLFIPFGGVFGATDVQPSKK